MVSRLGIPTFSGHPASLGSSFVRTERQRLALWNRTEVSSGHLRRQRRQVFMVWCLSNVTEARAHELCATLVSVCFCLALFSFGLHLYQFTERLQKC